jgi:hypothetical protein
MQWKRNYVTNKEQKLRKRWIPDRDYDSWKIPYFNQQNAQNKYNKAGNKNALFKKKDRMSNKYFRC